MVDEFHQIDSLKLIQIQIQMPREFQSIRSLGISELCGKETNTPRPIALRVNWEIA